MKKTHYKPHRLKPKKSFFKKPFFWISFLFLFLIAVGFYFFIFFKPLQINKIIISGNEEVTAEELEMLVFDNIKQKLWFSSFFRNYSKVSQSIFLVRTGKINDIILEQYPIIDSLNIKKMLPNTLEVNVKERKPFAIFHNNSEYYFIDEKGVIFKKLSIDLGLPSFFIVRQTETEQEEKQELILGKEVVKKEIMEKIAKITKGLEERSQLDIKEINIVSEERLNIKTDENWEAYFNLTANIDLQIEELNLLLEKEFPKESRAELQYIDLRFKDRVYYK